MEQHKTYSFRSAAFWGTLLFFFLFASTSRAQFTLGQPVTFYVFTTNPNGITWTGVTIDDTLPTDVTYVSCSGAPCSENGGLVVWNVGNVAPGATMSVSVSLDISTCASNVFSDQAAINLTSPLTTVLTNPITYTVSCLTNTPTPSPTVTSTFTITLTPTVTPSPTITLSPTVTLSPTITFTPTPTVPPVNDVFYINQNLFQPSSGPLSMFVGYNQYPGRYSLKIYNTAGEFIRDLSKDYGDPDNLIQPVQHPYFWDGKNSGGNDCASGIYIFYLIEPFDRKIKKVLLVH